MSKYDIIGLYDHNIESYEKIESKLNEDNIAAIVHATGTGKSYNALQLAYDNKDKKITYIVPSNSIIEHLKEIIEENPNLSLDKDFKNLSFITYQSLVDLTLEELANLDIEILILDEFHHIGAPVWGEKVDTIIETHKDMKIFGMTAYTVRDKGTIYERDMANPETEELFSNKIVSNYDLCDAMIDGVLPKPIYKSGYVFLEQTANSLEQKINKLNPNSKDYKELYPLLQDIKRRLNEALSVKDIFKNNIKKDGKYIYFCPVTVEKGKNDINTIMEEVKSWIKEMGLTEDDYELYITTSEMGKLGKENRKAFYNDVDLKGNKVNNKLRIMFAINQYNEGVHAPGLDGVIMGRSTQSDIVFFEQLGRALSVRGKTREEYDKLNSKSIEELIEMCEKRNININDRNSKEETIEQLLAPVIIDLANNIGFIKELENNLKDRVKEIQAKGPGNKRVIHLGNTSFDIDMLNENLFEILRYMYDRLTLTWEDKYNLAKAYYEHYGNLEIPARFKTINGIDYNENGIALGTWIISQRIAYNGKNNIKMNEKRINLLKSIGIRFEMIDYNDEWQNKYNLAKTYYEHYGNLEIPSSFKTKNGIDYDENGIALGSWIKRQRLAYSGKNNIKMNEKRINLLKSIGMRFEMIDYNDEWQNKYNLAKAYYEHYGNLEIAASFKTINGYEYDENGVALGNWIKTQREAYKGKGRTKINTQQIEMLEKIGMRFENIDLMEEWMKKYNLAKAYYEHYGNLDMVERFKTINGYEYDDNGVALGKWISNQRQAYKGKGATKINERQIQMLEKIGMRFENIDLMEEWMKKYNLAKAYYDHYGNLEINIGFKTINGYEYDENGVTLGSWIVTQRQAYKGMGGNKINTKQIEMLEQIGINWFSENINSKLQSEQINEKNTDKKQKEILNRTFSYLNTYDGDKLPSKKQLNEGFVEQLNKVKK